MTVYDCQDPAGRTAGLDEAVHAVSRGALVVLPTDTVYGIGADAFDARAVARLLSTKGRGRLKPPPVLVGDPATLEGLATDVAPEVRTLVERFWPGPLTVVCRAQPSLTWDLGDTQGTVALRMPADDVALALLRRTGPLAVSSANLSGRDSAVTVQQAVDYFGDQVAVYLDAGTSAGRTASTIVDATSAPMRVLRHGALSREQLAEVVADIDRPAGASELPAGAGGADTERSADGDE